MGMHIADTCVKGVRHAYFGEVLCGSGTGNTPFLVRNVVGDPRMKNTQEGLHHLVERRITGQIPQRQAYWSLNYPPMLGTGNLHR